jgi:hypothetical protein
MVLYCPAYNVNVTRPPELLKGGCRSRCEVCDATGFVDTDEREGKVSGTVTFGAAHVDGIMEEEHVLDYVIYAADSCGAKLGAAIGYVRRQHVPRYCCQPGTYLATLSGAEFPKGASKVIVVVRTSHGEMPSGLGVQIEDYVRPVEESAGRHPHELSKLSFATILPLAMSVHLL